MTIKETLKKANDILVKNNIEENFLKSRILLADVLKVNKEYLIIHEDEEILLEKEEEFFFKIKRLVKGKPIQYIINRAEFMGLEFYVDKNVLIPQPDTEILVENLIALVENLQKMKQNEIKILDLCTGSGAIVISLCKKLQNVKLFASDISDKALEIAKKNAKTNETQVEFIESDLFENINEKFDIIVSNPPYIETSEINKLSQEVQNEPRIALDGGNDGLRFYRQIAKNVKDFLNESGYLAVEIGYNQKDQVKNIFRNYGLRNIYTKKDLNGIERIIIGQK